MSASLAASSFDVEIITCLLASHWGIKVVNHEFISYETSVSHIGTLELTAVGSV